MKTLKQLKTELYQSATSKGACDTVEEVKSVKNKKQLLKLVKDNFYWCYRVGVINIDILLDDFGVDLCLDLNIYLNGEHNVIVRENIKIITLGSSSANVNTLGSSSANVNTLGSSSANVNTWDRSSANVETLGQKFSECGDMGQQFSECGDIGQKFSECGDIGQQFRNKLYSKAKFGSYRQV